MQLGGVRERARMVDSELEELKREFLAEAREKVAEMQTTLDGERDPQSLERLAYLAHQLKGSGGSYGYEKISTDAAELEKAFESMDGSRRTPGDVEARVQQHVLNLRSQIERYLRT
jgi:HPt (histidine-containing phosphotransfer) domain-containing protein